MDPIEEAWLRLNDAMFESISCEQKAARALALAVLEETLRHPARVRRQIEKLGR